MESDIGRIVTELCSSRVFPLQTLVSPSEEATVRQKPVSLVECPEAHVMIIPQATLAGKLKTNVMQYHNQCDKSIAEAVYTKFCHEVRSALTGGYECDVNGAPRPDTPRPLRVVLNGTFGNRQGLNMSSPGPFTHVIDT